MPTGFVIHLPVLPAQGISLLQAKNLGSVTELLFCMIDMRQDFLTSPFNCSILGRHLAQWSKLPNNTAVHQIWHAHQRLISYMLSTLCIAGSKHNVSIKAKVFC
jgi:hypothetical protein